MKAPPWMNKDEANAWQIGFEMGREHLPAPPQRSAGSEPVAWMCEKAIWETVETQRIGGRWLRYLTFDRPAEAEYTRNITPLYSVSPQEAPDRLVKALEECRTAIAGYCVTSRDQYPELLEKFYRELSRIDAVARTALASTLSRPHQS